MATTLVLPAATSPAVRRSLRSLVSPWRLLAVGTVVVLIIRAVHSVIDVDIYWHVRLGNEIIATHSIRQAGSDFAYGLPAHTWVTTQWLSEVVLATLYNLGGFGAISAMRVIMSAALLVVLGWQLLRRRRTLWSPVVFATTACIASEYFQERPQLFSLFFVVWLAGVLRDEIVGAHRRSWALVIVVTWLWANVHGMWILVPTCYGLLALGKVVEARLRRFRPALRQTAIALGALVAGAVTPVGPRLLSSTMGFPAAARQIKEWQPTNLHSSVVILFAIMVAVTVVSWARGGPRVEVSEIVYVGGITAFALYAFRDVPPAALLLAPIILHRLERSFPRPDRVRSERERSCLAAVIVLVVLLGLAAVAARSAKTPALPPTVPRLLAQQIAADPRPHRVLDDYNASGAVILWGGPLAKVAIDGRADRYGARFIDDYSQLMLTMGDWQEQLTAFDPDYALLRRDMPLVRELIREGWTLVDADSSWALLRSSQAR